MIFCSVDIESSFIGRNWNLSDVKQELWYLYLLIIIENVT